MLSQKKMTNFGNFSYLEQSVQNSLEKISLITSLVSVSILTTQILTIIIPVVQISNGQATNGVDLAKAEDYIIYPAISSLITLSVYSSLMLNKLMPNSPVNEFNKFLQSYRLTYENYLNINEEIPLPNSPEFLNEDLNYRD